MGSLNQKQLLVWEWQTETFVIKQQGSLKISAVAINDDLTIATGDV